MQSMSSLPEISQDHRQKNIRKLINQNKKLRQEILTFEQQINQIILTYKEQRNKANNQEEKRPFSLQKKLQTAKIEQSSNPHNITDTLSPQISNMQSIQYLLQTNSPLIERKIIPELKQTLEYLKSTNIKDNIHYILQEEDQLKIVKKEWARLRKQKEVFTGKVKDKKTKLQKGNNQLESHKSSLRQELNAVIKFNRQSSSNITQLEREIRKYHFILHEFKKLSSSSIIPSQKSEDKVSVQKMKQNPGYFLGEIDGQMSKNKHEIAQIQAKWKNQLEQIDKEYYQLKEQLQKRLKQQSTLQLTQNFYNTRVLVMKDQEKLIKDKERKNMLKPSPFLQKQLQDYIKQEQEKIIKKQLYLNKHLPKNYQDQQLELNVNSSKKAQNPQNPSVQTMHNDKNITKLKHYFTDKQKADKQTEGKLKKRENHRLQRSWSSKNQDQTEQHREPDSSSPILNGNRQKPKERAKPRILLKSVKLGTTFNNYSSDEETPKISK